MKRTLSYLPLLILALLATGCGDFYEFPVAEPVPARTMMLPRKVVNMVVGDQYRVPVTFTPADVTTEAVWWLPADDAIARFKNDTLIGVAQGRTVAYVTSVSDRLQDSCLVNVLPEMYLNPKGYIYDMVIYASVNIHGKAYTQQGEDSLIICAYCDDELRGIGKMRRWQDRDYMELRVWSPFYYGDLIDLRCYYRGQAKVELFPNTLTFDGESHGTLSNLYQLVLDENAEEYNFGLEFGPEGEYEEEETGELVGGDVEDE